MEKIYPAITAAGRLTQGTQATPAPGALQGRTPRVAAATRGSELGLLRCYWALAGSPPKTTPLPLLRPCAEESAASAASLTGVCPDSGLVLAFLQRFMERGLQGPAAGNGPAEAEAGAGPEAPAEGDESRLEQLNSGGSLPPAAEGSPVPGSSVASALSSAATTSAVTGSAPELAAVVGAGAAAEAAAGPAAVEQPGQAGGGTTSSGAAELEPSLSQLLGALSLGVTAELGRVPSELRLLQASALQCGGGAVAVAATSLVCFALQGLSCVAGIAGGSAAAGCAKPSNQRCAACSCHAGRGCHCSGALRAYGQGGGSG